MDLGPWTITVWYLLLLGAFGAVAKVASALLSRAATGERLLFLLLSPALSIDTWSAREPVTLRSSARLVARGLGEAAALAACARWWRLDLEGCVWLTGYAAIVPLYLLVETFGTWLRIAYLPFGLLPAIHDRPWAASGVSDFWGRRWNRLVADWLAQVCFQPLRRRPTTGLFVAFAVSGLLHEYLASVPLYLLTGRALFGRMTLYFVLQAAAVVVERRWLKRSPRLRRAFASLVILAPAPLVLNEASLRIFRFVG